MEKLPVIADQLLSLPKLELLLLLIRQVNRE